jgi:hypothetical protein
MMHRTFQYSCYFRHPLAAAAEACLIAVAADRCFIIDRESSKLPTRNRPIVTFLDQDSFTFLVGLYALAYI